VHGRLYLKSEEVAISYLSLNLESQNSIDDFSSSSGKAISKERDREERKDNFGIDILTKEETRMIRRVSSSKITPELVKEIANTSKRLYSRKNTPAKHQESALLSSNSSFSLTLPPENDPEF